MPSDSPWTLPTLTMEGDVEDGSATVTLGGEADDMQAIGRLLPASR